MGIRDFCAGGALAGLANRYDGFTRLTQASEKAFSYAGAMLAAREKRDNKTEAEKVEAERDAALGALRKIVDAEEDDETVSKSFWESRLLNTIYAAKELLVDD